MNKLSHLKKARKLLARAARHVGKAGITAPDLLAAQVAVADELALGKSVKKALKKADAADAAYNTPALVEKTPKSAFDLDPANYDDWLAKGLALHHQYGGSDKGLKTWNKWASTAPNYDADQVREKWAAFDREAAKNKAEGKVPASVG